MYSRSSVRLACTALSLVAVGALSHAASAQNAFYTTGTYTVDAAHSVTGYAYAGADSSGNYKDSNGSPYNPTVNLVSGGSIGNALVAYNSSTVSIRNGSISSDLAAFDSSTVSISGGSIGSYLNAFSSSTVSISGGTFGKYSNGVNFFDNTTGAFTLIGSNLTATAIGADTFIPGTNYALSGTLQDGTNLSGYVLDVANGAKGFTLQSTPAAVPEPGNMALLVGMSMTGTGLLARRRRARK